jgi:hypothetical protein
MAMRGAKADAQRQLLEALKGVQLQSGTYVRDMITRRDDIRTRVQGYIRNAEVVEEWYEDGVAYSMQRLDANMVRRDIR